MQVGMRGRARIAQCVRAAQAHGRHEVGGRVARLERAPCRRARRLWAVGPAQACAACERARWRCAGVAQMQRVRAECGRSAGVGGRRPDARDVVASSAVLSPRSPGPAYTPAPLHGPSAMGPRPCRRRRAWRALTASCTASVLLRIVAGARVRDESRGARGSEGSLRPLAGRRGRRLAYARLRCWLISCCFGNLSFARPLPALIGRVGPPCMQCQ